MASAVSDAIRSAACERLGVLEGEAFLARLELIEPDLTEALQAVYGTTTAIDELVADLVADALDAAAGRREDLAVLDRRREVDPTWFLAQDMIGYVCYADRFAGTLRRVGEHLDLLEELGVRYLHLMPLLKPREGENDGGYAVEDYDAVDPRLGTMADLEALATALHGRGVALCADLVLNHTAREHEWAQKALAGEPAYRAFYRFFPDRTMPDAFEATLPEVFPGMAPGNFTFVEDADSWVWTTFHEFQWDLDWSNPAVFRAMLGVLFRLVNHGVDVVRLDAVPFMWKRLGTDCQNQPEAHRILQAIRALTRLARPGVVLKAEAIVGPDLLVPYLGAHDYYRPECDLAYDNQLMVMLWSALAARDATLPTQALQRRRPAPAGTGWVTYVRCHDDIGWAVADEDATAIGWDPAAHRRFLADFYAGDLEASYARGARFQHNLATGDARTSGTAASLAGLEEALETADGELVDAALTRLETLYAVAYSFGGIPLIYMGDEIALLNDREWAADPAHADDNRWLHRPVMDWTAAAGRHQRGSVEGRMFAALGSLGEARRSTPALRTDAACTVLSLDNPHVLAFVRRHPRAAPVLVLANFSDATQRVPAALLAGQGLHAPRVVHSTGEDLEVGGDHVVLPPWGHVWLSEG